MRNNRGFIGIVLLLIATCSVIFYFTLVRTNKLSDVLNILGLEVSESIVRQTMLKNHLSRVDTTLKETPKPIAVISMEGKVASDPLRLATVESLKDVWKVYDYSFAYKISQDNKYRDKAREFLIAWSNTYKATGNPIDESHLIPMILGYEWVRDSFEPEDRLAVDLWFQSIANKEYSTTYPDARGKNNWNSHRINIVGSVGFITKDNDLITKASDEFIKHVEVNLNADGSTYDFVERDALHYHYYDLYPLIVFTKVAKLHGANLFDYTTKSGASLKKSVEFGLPYLTGDKTHTEFLNSKVAWDKTTSKPKTGNTVNPWSGIELVEQYYFFDPSVLKISQSIRKSASLYPSLNLLVSQIESEQANPKAE